MKNTSELREFICGEMQALRRKERTPEEATAQASLAGKVIGLLNVDLRAAKMFNRHPNVKFLSVGEPINAITKRPTKRQILPA